MTLSASLLNNPELDDWITISPDGQLIIATGKAELGQKITNAIAIIAAEELDVDPARITVITAETGVTPDERYTGGSNSMEESGNAVRQATAHARRHILELAASAIGEDVENLIVDDGTISGRANDKRITYWTLMGGKTFSYTIQSEINTKPPSAYRVIGKPITATGFEGLVTGTTAFLHDMELPGMVHARAIRPPHYLARLIDYDEDQIRQMPGVIDVIRDGSFLAVVAKREDQVVRAANKLRSIANWDDAKRLNADVNIYEQLITNPRQSLLVIDGVPDDTPIPKRHDVDASGTSLTATYLRPYHMHASMAPSAAIAHFTDVNTLEVWSHSQGVYPLRSAIAGALSMAENNIKVTHAPGPGCYGHNAAEDAALDAALVARALMGHPVLLKWEREDEHAWEPYGSAMRMEMMAELDDRDRISYWSHDSYSDTQVARPGADAPNSKLLPAWYFENPIPAPEAQPSRISHGGIHRNSDPIYALDSKRIVKHLVQDLPLRVSALRGLAAYANIFALESFMDELADKQGIDPLDFRLSHLEDTRARDVLELAAQKSNWQNRKKTEGQGFGLAVAQYKNIKAYAAVYVDLTVDDEGNITLQQAVIAADAGQVVDPEGLRSQLEGGLIQSASWSLKEEVTYDSGGITSRDWDSYPILGFSDVPEIETVLINRPEEKFLGSGEATMGPTVAAIGNAVFDATGIRLRQIPFTPENVRLAAANS